MIKALEISKLNDKYIDVYFINNIKKDKRIYFNKNDIYYFGNYKNDCLNDIVKIINKNHNNIKNAIERGVKFIITGNSLSIFNNTFVSKNINLFNNFYHKKSCKIIKITSLDKANYCNFRYKNLICLNKIKKTKHITLSY